MTLAPRVIAIAGLLGCGFAAGVPASTTDEGALAATVVPSGAFPKMLVDPLGARVELRRRPRRIASISLVTDELLLALIEPSRTVGVTFLVDDASTTLLAGSVSRSIARTTEEPESLLALEPDLVLTAGYSRAETVRLLQGAGVPIVRVGRHDSVADVLDAIRLVGRAVGEEARADEMIVALERRIAGVEARAARRGRMPRVLIWEAGGSYGLGTLQDDLVRRAGGVNVAASAGLRGPVELTEEALITLAPEIIVTSVEGAAPRLSDPTLLGDAPVLREVAAVRYGRVHGLPRRTLGSASHHVVDALESLADALDASTPREAP
jgi:iron complex transport system substrate-binding protein